MELGADRAGNARAILPVLIFATMVMSVISTLGTPMVPTIAREQGVSLEAAQWILTVTLLVGAVFTPVAGRLADGPWRKQIVLGTLLAVTFGSVLSAAASQFPLFIGGRALQGAGMALVPLAIAVARDALPPEQRRSGIAILSITTAAGTGLGYPLTGIMSSLFNYHAGFWFAAGSASSRWRSSGGWCLAARRIRVGRSTLAARCCCRRRWSACCWRSARDGRGAGARRRSWGWRRARSG